jgi:hypothetical protein
MFVVAAIIQPHPIHTYFFFVLVGLIFCPGGDVCLALPQEKAFLFGLGGETEVEAFFAKKARWIETGITGI